METSKNKISEAGNVCLKRRSPTLQVVPVLCFLFFSLSFNLRPALAETGKASWYSTEACRFNPDPKCPTSNGESLYELERTKQDFAATWKYRMGSRLAVTNIRNGKTVVVRVVDRGPAKRLGRVVDLSKSAFRKISSLREGVIKVKVEVL
jgi:rare lipoprotein A (peptidoglycan hydrolase)